MAGRKLVSPEGVGRPGLVPGSVFNGDPQSVRGVKEWLSRHMAYDRLVADHGERAGRLEYLHLLRLAAELGEAAISGLVSECSGPAHPGKWRVADLRRYLGLSERPSVPELQLQPELASYDALLSGDLQGPDDDDGDH